jgi:acetylcholinesterase
MSEYAIILFSRSNPALEGEHWPMYTKENPIYFIFNAEGEDDLRGEKYGRGPMATSCAFWNDFLPKLRSWSCKYFPSDD